MDNSKNNEEYSGTNDEAVLSHQQHSEDVIPAPVRGPEPNNVTETSNDKPAQIINAAEPQPVVIPVKESPEDVAAIETTPSEIQTRLREIEDKITSGFSRILDKFEQKIKYDQSKEDLIARLHGELQTYKSDLLTRATHPFVRGMIRLYDDISKTVESLQKKEDSTPDSGMFYDAAKGFQETIEILLNQNGIYLFRETGETFNPRRQTAIDTQPTENPDEVGKVCRHLRPGWEQNGKVIEAEKVYVLVLEKKG